MLTLTDTAANEIRNLVAHPEVPDEGGLRIASTDDGALSLALTSGPAAGDAVVEGSGARVFLEPTVGQLLDDKELDAEVDDAGQVRFSVATKL